LRLYSPKPVNATTLNRNKITTIVDGSSPNNRIDHNVTVCQPNVKSVMLQTATFCHALETRKFDQVTEVCHERESRKSEQVPELCQLRVTRFKLQVATVFHAAVTKV